MKNTDLTEELNPPTHERWLWSDVDNLLPIEWYMPLDPYEFGIKVLDSFLLYHNAIDSMRLQWKDLYKKDNSKRIEDCIEEITDGEVTYCGSENAFRQGEAEYGEGDYLVCDD